MSTRVTAPQGLTRLTFHLGFVLGAVLTSAGAILGAVRWDAVASPGGFTAMFLALFCVPVLLAGRPSRPGPASFLFGCATGVLSLGALAVLAHLLGATEVESLDRLVSTRFDVAA